MGKESMALLDRPCLRRTGSGRGNQGPDGTGTGEKAGVPADQDQRRWRPDRNRPCGRGRFSGVSGQQPFQSLCMIAEDGTKEIGICRFVDERQVDVNGQVWEIGEFLWQMERRGIQV